MLFYFDVFRDSLQGNVLCSILYWNDWMAVFLVEMKGILLIISHKLVSLLLNVVYTFTHVMMTLGVCSILLIIRCQCMSLHLIFSRLLMHLLSLTFCIVLLSPLVWLICVVFPAVKMVLKVQERALLYVFNYFNDDYCNLLQKHQQAHYYTVHVWFFFF